MKNFILTRRRKTRPMVQRMLQQQRIVPTPEIVEIVEEEPKRQTYQPKPSRRSRRKKNNS